MRTSEASEIIYCERRQHPKTYSLQGRDHSIRCSRALRPRNGSLSSAFSQLNIYRLWGHMFLARSLTLGPHIQGSWRYVGRYQYHITIICTHCCIAVCLPITLSHIPIQIVLGDGLARVYMM